MAIRGSMELRKEMGVRVGLVLQLLHASALT